MNGMERKVAKRSVALECNGEKRKPRAAGIGRHTIHALHLRRVVGAFVVLIPATMLIRKILTEYRECGRRFGELLLPSLVFSSMNMIFKGL